MYSKPRRYCTGSSVSAANLLRRAAGRFLLSYTMVTRLILPSALIRSATAPVFTVAIERRSKPRFKVEDPLVHRFGRSRWIEVLTYVRDLSVLGYQKHHVLLAINPASRFDQRFRFDLN